MTCRTCGTEIADKALICYRCGTATTEAKFSPPSSRPRWSRTRMTAAGLALVLAVILAYVLGW
jgi:cytochrome b561